MIHKKSIFLSLVILLILNPCSSIQAFTWAPYNPTIHYNFKDEYPNISKPLRDLDDCSGVVGSIQSEWWTFKWGPNKRSLVDSAAVLAMLQRMDTDFAYFRDSLGWPPDRRAKEGYKSAIYLYGSGLCTDKQDSNALGGWQSSIYSNGKHYPMVLISYYPVYAFSPKAKISDKAYQRGAVVHEGIHSVLADLPGCKKAAWFHEGGNTWLQQEADTRRSGNYNGMGFLNVASFLAPFMPIECYSGWLQDGSFGGPSAEGVNLYRDGKQICTWRNLLGGVQYSNVFPTFLGLTLGSGSIAWIWRNCPDRVLEGMAKQLGETQIRRLIYEYRAKQALVDFGPWSKNLKQLIHSNMGTTIQSEWKPFLKEVKPWKATPYVYTNLENGWLVPDSTTLPGWSGSNQIPFTTKGKKVEIEFVPQSSNMICQLAYRNAKGDCVYSTPVEKGICRMELKDAQTNQVVIAVITNTDYIYQGEKTRKAKYGYRIRLKKGIVQTADIHQTWF